MKKLALVLLPLLVCSTVFGGGLQKEQVAADAKWVLHVDIQGLVGSQIGQYLQKHLVATGADEGLKQFADTFGFDPIKDLKSLTAYGQKLGEEEAVAIFNGVVNKEKLLGLLSGNEGHKETKYGDRTIHEWTEKGKKDPTTTTTKYGAFYNDDLTLIAGSMDLLKKAIDVLDKKAEGMGKDSFVPVASVGAFAQIAALVPMPDAPGANAALAKKVKGFTAEVGEANKSLFAKITLTTATAKDAEEARKILDGLIAFVSMAGAMGEQNVPQDPVKTQVLEMIQAIKVAAKDETVFVEGAWTVDQVTSLIEKIEAAKQQPKVQP
jgi:hypothetical protein